ncbi:related to transposase [Sporisorium reilianum f. sp. reilianum]|uniref:Related to transposase n=1 Tax=Sporisorium reilianum f. sp. reilianum TaxID=72559 RepID=A0A2N8UFP6_9BASI|nr:related to transposase [Sporisorium reilianum f. sp. reilianum]
MPATNRKRNVVPDPIRKKIVEFVLHRGETKADVAKRFDYAWSTVDSIVRKYEETGESSAQRKKGGAFRGSKVNDEHLEVMLSYVADHPSTTVDEISRHLHEQTGLELSQTATRLALRDCLHITLKWVNVEHDCHNSPETIAARQAWVQAFRMQGLSLDEAVFLNEAGFHLQQTRNVRRAPIGQRAMQRNRPYDRGPNLSLLVAVDRNGIQAREVKTGAWNSTALTTFFRESVFLLFEGQSKTFVLDNARPHHSAIVRQAIEGAGHRIQFLPPYSPWFNIAEKVFAKVKPFVSRQDLHEGDDIRSWIDTSLSTITPAHCRGWLHETNHWMMVAEAGHPLDSDHDAEAALRRHGLFHEAPVIDPSLPA